MKTRHIRHKTTGTILFEGRFASDALCAEEAVQRHTDLSCADLRFWNLQGANLDNAQLRGADLGHCNLANANLSECNLENTDLAGATLVGACLAETALSGADMTGAQFGATDIAGAVFDHCRFNTLSALHLPFHDAQSLYKCVFEFADGGRVTFSAPPIVIAGLSPTPIYIIEHNIFIGHRRIFPHNRRVEAQSLPGLLRSANG